MAQPSPVICLSSDSEDSAADSSPPPSPPLQKKRKFRLGENMYEEVKSGALLDVIIVADSRKLFVHKAVVSAVSNKFKRKLEKQFSGGDPHRKGVIELPPGTSAEVAKAFIKTMYLEKMDSKIDLAVLLGVMSLCDKYLGEDLLGPCIDSVIQMINQENCLQICESSLKMKRCIRLKKTAFLCVTQNIGHMLMGGSWDWNGMRSKMFKEILRIEGPDIVEVPEASLFEKLLRWREMDPSRERVFRESLLPLIRFPVMELSTISNVVKPSGVLTGEELSDIYGYIIGGDLLGNSVPKFITHRRKTKLARNTKELSSSLLKAEPGDLIQLVAETYHGSFEIPEKVTLKGAGSSTVIKGHKRNKGKSPLPTLCIKHDSKILELRITSKRRGRVGLEIRGSRNSVTNVAFKNCHLLAVSGKYNVINNIACVGGQAGVIIQNGQNNSVSDGSFENMKFGVRLDRQSSHNIVKNINCRSVQFGVSLKSNDNVVEDVAFAFFKPINGLGKVQSAVRILGACRNTVSRVHCQKYDEMMDNMGGLSSVVVDWSESTDNTLSHLSPGCVKLGGKNNHLYKVDADLIIISGQGHTVKECSSPRCVNSGSANVQLIDCNFSF